MRLALAALLALSACTDEPAPDADGDDWFDDSWASESDADTDADSDTDTDTDVDVDDPPDDPDDDPDWTDGVLEDGVYEGTIQMTFVSEAAGAKRDCHGDLVVEVEGGHYVAGEAACWFTGTFLGNEVVDLAIEGWDEDEGDLYGSMALFLGTATMDGGWYGGGGEGSIFGEFSGWDVYADDEIDTDVEWMGDFRAALEE